MSAEVIQLIVILGGLAALLIVMGCMCMTGKLPMNSLVGIRLPSTMVSAGAWKAGHKAAGPYVIVGGVCAAAGAVTLLLFPSLEPTIALITAAGAVVCIILAAFVASGAAKRDFLPK